MKHNTNPSIISKSCIFVLLCAIQFSTYSADVKDRPATDTIADLIKCGDVEISKLEDIDPASTQPGMIPYGVSDIALACTHLKAQLPISEETINSDDTIWKTRIDLAVSALSLVITSGRQVDLFRALPAIEPFMSFTDSEKPAYVMRAEGYVKNLSTTIVSAAARHIFDTGGRPTSENLSHLVLIFSSDGFVQEPDWEDQVIPVDAAGVFILDSAAVLARLKGQPWERAERFVGGQSSASAFKRYEAGGDGLEVLREKFGMEGGVIRQRWDELAAWVEARRAEEEPGN